MTPFALAVALATALLGAPQGSPAAETAWLPPVRPLVVERPFVAPAGPYAPGHRGVDLKAEPGTPVRAPASGVVRVAGTVAGKDVVSLEHAQPVLGRRGWRTTYEGVRATVTVGESVTAGESLGLVVTHAHGRGVHWGLKLGREYADPLLLLRRPVVLKPLRS